MVEEYRSLARGAAWSYWRRAPRADFDEVQAVALAGLCQAAERFPAYNAEHGYDPGDRRYLVAFLNRRVHGAILDWARSQDWVTRAQRRTIKILEAAAEDAWPGASAAEVAAAAGLAEDEALAALAAQAAGPMRLDDIAPGGEVAENRTASWTGSLADASGDVESKVVVGSILAAVAEVIMGLPWQQLGLLVSIYVEGRPLREYAEAAGIEPDQARRLHESVVLEIHDVMLSAASERGCGCGRRGSCGCTAR